jgi:hypothetical protein
MGQRQGGGGGGMIPLIRRDRNHQEPPQWPLPCAEGLAFTPDLSEQMCLKDRAIGVATGPQPSDALARMPTDQRLFDTNRTT